MRDVGTHAAAMSARLRLRAGSIGSSDCGTAPASYLRGGGNRATYERLLSVSPTILWQAAHARAPVVENAGGRVAKVTRGPQVAAAERRAAVPADAAWRG